MDILLVDDSKTMRVILQRAIRQAGYRTLAVAEAENGKDALDKMRGHSPRLVLSDWNMPEMSGIDFLRHLRAESNAVPFGLVTSESSAEMKALAQQAGVTFMLAKPFTPDDIQEALAPILG
jgi:two-component system chemotaxis response regulator CheY